MRFTVNDLVLLPDQTPAVVTAVYPPEAGQMGMCDVRAPGRDVRSFYDHELTAVPHRPAPGQRWTCLARPDLRVEVVDVDATGLEAECRLASGRFTRLVLPGRYRLSGVA